MAKAFICFDVDHTLEISQGPIKIDDLRRFSETQYVGICGNWAVFVRYVPDWDKIVCSIGQMDIPKAAYLTQIKTWIIADRYIMVGNNEPDKSQDEEAANLAGWEFIKEDKFDAVKLLLELEVFS